MDYDNIINLPPPKSKTRKPMSLEARAAQFAPFAALHGHEDAIEDTARLNASAFLAKDTPINDESGLWPDSLNDDFYC